MSAPAPPRAARSAKGFRVIRRFRLAADTPKPGLLGRLWQRLCAALRVTPQQWHAHELARRAGTGTDLRGRVLTAGGQMMLMPPRPATAPRRPAQADLP